MHAIIHSRNKFSCLWCIQKDWNFSCLLQVSIPCKKKCYRLYGKEGYPLVDIMTGEDEPSPKVNNIHGNTYKQWACIKECLHFETLGYQTCTISSLGSDVSAIVIVLWNLKQLVGVVISRSFIDWRKAAVSSPFQWIKESIRCSTACWGITEVLLAWKFMYELNNYIIFQSFMYRASYLSWSIFTQNDTFETTANSL